MEKFISLWPLVASINYFFGASENHLKTNYLRIDFLKLISAKTIFSLKQNKGSQNVTKDTHDC